MPKIKTHHIYSGIQLIFLLGILMFSAILFNRTGDDFLRFLIICFDSVLKIASGCPKSDRRNAFSSDATNRHTRRPTFPDWQPTARAPWPIDANARSRQI